MIAATFSLVKLRNHASLARRILLATLATFALATFAASLHWHSGSTGHSAADDDACSFCLQLSHVTGTPSSNLAAFSAPSPDLIGMLGRVQFILADVLHTWFARGPPGA